MLDFPYVPQFGPEMTAAQAATPWAANLRSPHTACGGMTYVVPLLVLFPFFIPKNRSDLLLRIT